MKKKGYFAAFLLCVLAVSAFLFWPEKGEKEESEAEEVQKKQIYVLCAYETRLHQQILKEVAENYSSRSGCAKVNMEFIPKENFKKEICLRMDNGRTADLIICDNGMMPALIDMGVFADISAYVETCCQDSMNFQKLWNTTMDDGKYYGIPFTCDPYVLFYNSDVFRENGLSAPEDWDGLLDTCSALQDSVGDKFGFAAKRPEEIYAFYRALLYACGGSLNTIDQEGGIRAAGILEELKRSRYVGKQTINLTEADVARSFAEGKVLMMANRLSASTILRSSRMEFSAGIIPLPGDVRESLMLSGENIGVTGYADREAYRFLTYLYRDEIQERICNVMDTLPVKAAVPYQAKRVGPDEGTEFLDRYINEGWCAETNNSWFEIAQQVSESLYELMEVRGTPPEDTARELQNAVKLIIIKKR